MINLSIRPAITALGTGVASIAIAGLLATPISAYAAATTPTTASTTVSIHNTTKLPATGKHDTKTGPHAKPHVKPHAKTKGKTSGHTHVAKKTGVKK